MTLDRSNSFIFFLLLAPPAFVTLYLHSACIVDRLIVLTDRVRVCITLAGSDVKLSRCRPSVASHHHLRLLRPLRLAQRSHLAASWLCCAAEPAVPLT